MKNFTNAPGFIMKFCINNTDWEKFLGQISKTYHIYAPQEVYGELAYQLLAPDNVSKTIYDTYRAVQPLKTFFSLPQEKVTVVTPQAEKTIVLGVKNCDLKAVSVMDKIFLEGDFVDPFYKQRRETTLIVSSLPGSSPTGGCQCSGSVCPGKSTISLTASL